MSKRYEGTRIANVKSTRVYVRVREISPFILIMLTLSRCFRNSHSLSISLFSSLDVAASSGLRINLASSQLLRVVGHDDDEDDDTPCETERGGKKGKGRREEAKRIGRDAFFREKQSARGRC